eukprot:360020-Chlamydomonas_euryale.AAC.4
MAAAAARWGAGGEGKPAGARRCGPACGRRAAGGSGLVQEGARRQGRGVCRSPVPGGCRLPERRARGAARGTGDRGRGRRAGRVVRRRRGRGAAASRLPVLLERPRAAVSWLAPLSAACVGSRGRVLPPSWRETWQSHGRRRPQDASISGLALARAVRPARSPHPPILAAHDLIWAKVRFVDRSVGPFEGRDGWQTGAGMPAAGRACPRGHKG